MALLCLTAVVAFSAGFGAAALLSQGRRQDTRRGESLLARAVADFTEAHADHRDDIRGRVSIARSELDALTRALDVRDEIVSA